MAFLFQDTLFGHFVRATTRSKLLPWPETVDEATRHAYLETQQMPSSLTPDSTDDEKSDTEAPSKSAQVVIDWTKKDSANPHDWSSAKKAWVLAQIALLTNSIYIGAAIYTIGLDGISQQFRVSQTTALLGLTVFIIGYGVGPIIWCPISELASVGRSPVYIGTLIVFVALQPGIIYAKNISMLLAFRFLTGFFGSPSLALGGATAADMYGPRKFNYAISIWGASAALGPALGPLLAGFAVEYKSWTWSIWELMWLSGFCLTVLVTFLPETLEANILHRRAHRLQNIIAPKDRGTSTTFTITSRPDLEAKAVDGAKQGREMFLGVITLSILEPLVLVLNLYISLVYALLYLWFESFPLVFVGIHGFSSGQLGLAFIGLLVGFIVGVISYCIYLRLRIEPFFKNDSANRKLVPEIYMEPAMVGAFLIPIALLVFAWSARSGVHWITPIIGTFIFGPGAFLVFMSTISYLSAAYPKHTASVLGGNDLMRAGFGAGFPLFANAMFGKLGIDWGNTLLAGLAALFIPVPFVLVKFGGIIRKASGKALQDEAY